MNKLIMDVNIMKKSILVVVVSFVLFGCNADLKRVDGIELKPEKIADLKGVWVGEHCEVTSDSEMHRLTIAIDEYGNIEHGKRHYITDPKNPDKAPSYRCEGGFTESIDSINYIDSVIGSPWSYSDGSSSEYVKVINLNSGDSIAFEAKHYYHQDGVTLYRAVISEKAIVNEAIEHLDVDVTYRRVSL